MWRTLFAFVFLAWSSGCHDFEAEYLACVDASRCERTDAGSSEADAGSSDAGVDAGVDAGALDGGGTVAVSAVCIDDVCWESPRPAAVTISDVFAVSATEAWFVGADGVVAHVSGETVETFAAGTEPLHSVSSDGARVLAVANTQGWDLRTRSSTNTTTERLDVIHHVGDGGYLVGGAVLGVGTLFGADATFALNMVKSVGNQQVIKSVTGVQGALACVASDGAQGSLFRQLDATNLAQGWVEVTSGPMGDYGAVSFDARGLLWLSSDDVLQVFDGGEWSNAQSPGLGTITDLSSGAGGTSLVTASGQVATCTSPGACTTRLNGLAPLRSVSTAGDVVWAAGDLGTMVRLQPDGGTWNLGNRRMQVNDVALTSTGMWAVATKGTSGELWWRDGGVWTVVEGRASGLSSLAEFGGVLHVAADDGLLQRYQGSLRASQLRTLDGGVFATPTAFFDLAPAGNDEALAVGARGSVFRLSAGGWSSLRPGNGAALCEWATHFDAGGNGCTLTEVLALEGRGYLAAGGLSNNTGFFVVASADGGVTVTPTAAVRSGVARLSDGGVFICGWDAEISFGSPELLVNDQLVGLPAGCTSAARVGETLVLTNIDGVHEVRFDEFDHHWHAVRHHLMSWLNSANTIGDDVYLGGNESRLVRLRPDGG